jgi:pimeloyl-ACP methyl ester carboxylesterase
VDGMIQRLISPTTVSEKPELAERIKEIMMSSSVEGITGDLRGMMARPDSRPMLPRIRVPTVVIAGRDDQLIPPEEAQAMNELIPEAKLEIISHAGHLPCMEQPELYNRILVDFIQLIERGTP